MNTKLKLHPQYLTDEQGRKTSVLLPFEEYSELLEDFDDLATSLERKTEATISHEDAIKELKADGLL